VERPESGTYIDNLAEHLYHDRTHGYSSSDIKMLLKSTPYHFKYFHDKPATPPTEAMKLGSMLHGQVLRPEAMDEEITVMPDFNLRTKDGRANKEQFLEDNPHKLVITPKQWEEGMRMADSVSKNDQAMELLEGSIRERSMWAEAMGLPIRARADAYKKNALLELKSTRDASFDGFRRQIANLKYHVSLIHYAVCLEQCVPEIESVSNMEYYFICVENSEPYTTAVYKASQNMIDEAWEEWKRGMELLKTSIESDHWEGYMNHGEIEEIDLPSWAYKSQKIEDLDQSSTF